MTDSTPTLTDGYARQLTYLRLSVTDVCNFRCNYCLPDGYLADNNCNNFLSLEEIHKISQAFALCGTKKIRITGGEPLLRKDLPQIIERCKSVEGIDTLALTTNAYSISKHLPKLVDAGLDQINISADSLQPENFQLITGHNKLDEVLSGLDMALERGLKKVKLNVVLMREYNRSELSDFLDFVRQRPIVLRFIELMETGDNKAFFKKQHVSGQEIRDELEQDGWLQVLREAHAGPALEFSHPDYAGNVGLIMPYSRNFCTNCNRLRVSSRGNLHLCLFGEEHHSLRPYILEESPQQLAKRIQHLVSFKKAEHGLHENNPGTTRHLAMLGG
ncbi:cyclic pyranopterin monophosphate synthase subunit MoaA [Alteromonadaceae bacterium Bs31]|nr:cyclic pyranopterin monophosphate synthase subunit MoaA [Alteromonadaceae bacterium Bs31]